MPRNPSFFASRKYLLATVAFAALTVVAVNAGAEPEYGNIAQTRQHAQSLAVEGNCQNALYIFERVAVLSGLATDHIAAGECAIRAGDARRASDSFWEASSRRDQLSTTEQKLYMLRSLGYQAEAAGQPTRARLAWEWAAHLSSEPMDGVMAARASRLDDRSSAAGAWLNSVDAGALSGPPLALFYEEKARSMADLQTDAAIMYLERSIAIEDAAYRRYERGLLLDRVGRNREALSEFEAALRTNPDNIEIVMSAGYAARRAGQDDRAVIHFERARLLDPDRQLINEEVAYAYKGADDEDAAAAAFRAAIDAYDRNANTDEGYRYRLRREVEQLERNHYGYTFLSYRDGSSNPGPNLPELGPVESQIGGEFGWQPDALNGVGTGLTLYGRGYASMSGRDFSFDADTAQLGIGARWKPLADYDLNLSAERMIAGGDQARDAWLLRASAGWSDGLDWRPGETSWNYTSIYGDLAYIPDAPDYFSAYLSARQGRRFAIGDGWAVTPYVVGVAQYSDDSFQERERYEVGPGVSVSRWLDDDEYRAHRQRIDFELEYRFGVGDRDEDAAIARVVWTF